MWYIYTEEHCSAIKKNEIIPSAPIWMGLENIILSDVSQRQISKNMKQMKLFTKQTQKTNLQSRKGKGNKGSIN